MEAAKRTVTGAGAEPIAPAGGEAGSAALEPIFAAAYEELCALASAQRRRWGGNTTLDTTALVHEAYLKLARQEMPLRNPACLFAVASRAMRHVLVNYAERQRAIKRGGEMRKVPLATLAVPAEAPAMRTATADEVLALNEALDRLGALSPRQRDVVECRFFGGLSVDETAAALDLSAATIKRDWRLARAWLHHQLSPGTSP